MLSQCINTLFLWVMWTIIVSSFITFKIYPSLPISKAEVASSRRSNLGFFRRTLAIAILCFWPPESWLPLFPTKVSSFSLSSVMKSKAEAFLKASYISSSELSSLARIRFSLIEVAKRTGYWVIYPIWLLSQSRSISFRLFPSRSISPSSGS